MAGANENIYKKYVELLDRAKSIYVVFTRKLKFNGNTIYAFKVLALVDNELIDLAKLMKQEKINFEYLSKNSNDFVVRVIGSNRIYELLCSIVLKAYNDHDIALGFANELMKKVIVLD